MFEMLLDPWVFALIAIYSLIWKAIVLWRSARRGQRVWFLILLVTNTLGILDAIYLIFFSGGVIPRKVPPDPEL